jgi:hypothetical protein
MTRFNGIVISTVIVAILSFVLHSAYTLPPVIAAHGYAGQNSKIFDTDQYEELIGTSTNVVQITTGLISTVEPRTQGAFFTITGSGIKWTCDGTTPSSSLGNPGLINGWYRLDGLPDVQGFRFVNDDGVGTATVHMNLQILGEQLP